MSRHLPTFSSRIALDFGTLSIDTSAFPCAPHPITTQLGPYLVPLSLDDARAFRDRLSAAIDHVERLRQPKPMEVTA